MNALKLIKLFLALFLLATAGIGNAWAAHGHFHSHFGIVVGPVWDPWYYPSPYSSPYYYPPNPPIVIERAPPVYIERDEAQPTPAPINYWYYCNASKAYYPYVKECPSGWQRVSPQPPNQP